MKLFLLLHIAVFSSCFLMAQNVGLGTNNPVEKLDIAGNVKTNGIIINNGGARHDFLMKSDSNGQVGFRKGHGGVGLNYIIAINGYYPNPENPPLYDVTIMGEIKLFAGPTPPPGWMFCQGQFINISQNQALFSLLEFNYGGNGITHFALPDLRGAVPVGVGTSVAGYTWNRNHKSD